MRNPILLTSLAFLGLSMPVGAEAQNADRWLPWVGCWESVDGAPASSSSELSEEAEFPEFLLCVTPLEGGLAVQLVSYQGGEATAREVLRSDGVATALEDEGCSGEQRGEWSDDGRRFFLSSQMVCGEGLLHEGRSVFSFLPDGREWIEVQSIRAQGGDPLLGMRRFRPAGSASLAFHGVTDPSQGLSLAVATARAEAASALTPDDVLELVEVVGAHGAGALVAEREQAFALNAATIRELAAQGLPGEVLDVMVATTYPERFALQGGSRDVSGESYRPYGSRRIYGAGPFGPRYGGFYGYDPFYSRYGYSYGSYGYGNYGWGYPRFGAGSTVVVVRPPTVQDRSRVDRNRGYISGGGSGSGSSARGSTPSRGTSQPNRPAVTPRGTQVKSPPPPTRSGSGEERRARRRNNGGNGSGGNR
ncbi:MAG: hypothetical protein WEA09_08415 [Gemmatimonadota bacterium]